MSGETTTILTLVVVTALSSLATLVFNAVQGWEFLRKNFTHQPTPFNEDDRRMLNEVWLTAKSKWGRPVDLPRRIVQRIDAIYTHIKRGGKPIMRSDGHVSVVVPARSMFECTDVWGNTEKEIEEVNQFILRRRKKKRGMDHSSSEDEDEDEELATSSSSSSSSDVESSINESESSSSSSTSSSSSSGYSSSSLSSSSFFWMRLFLVLGSSPMLVWSVWMMTE